MIFARAARVLVRFDHIARFIVNANHSFVRTAAKLCEPDCIAHGVWPGIPQRTERQSIGDQIDAAFIGSADSTDGRRYRQKKSWLRIPSKPAQWLLCPMSA